MTDDRRSPTEIEAEIAAERAKLSHDLEALQDRLTVDGLMDEVRLQVRGQIDAVTAQLRSQIGTVSNEVAVNMRDQIATTGRTVSRVAAQNPWPFAVIGAGLAWLAVSTAMPDRGARKRPRIGMAPVKRTVPTKPAHYDNSPADMAASRLEHEADDWAASVLDTGSNPIPPYDPEPSWARDDDRLTTSRR
ncbi:Protein of unknown function [Loktanella atrilutea]|uniref:Uncharacterized protein n=1 Tax=Loktanella atrilutea TaxID=366533 RepID=A0A1M5CCD0_LOKAT|nr:DUF3618 domain-containing protein [Loktanella atrilutea]SHF52413.1 Protein of unknown function [Loktanella atrilutea]